MMRTFAVLASVIAEALAVYTVAEWMAAGYDVDRRTVGWYSFVLVALAAFALPRLTDWLALSSRTAAALFMGTAFVVIYGVLRAVYAEDFALWDFGWLGDFIADSDTAVGEGSHAFISAVLLLALWARQSTRSAFDIDLESTPRAIGPLFLTVTIVTVLGALTDRTGEVGRGAAGFYAFAVLALACSQLALSGAGLPDLQAGSITAVLFGGVAAATVACLVVAGVLIALVGPFAGPPLSVAFDALLTAILTPPAYVLAWLFALIIPDDLEIPLFTNNGERQVLGESEEQDDDGPSTVARVGAAGMRSLLIFGLLLGAIGLVLYFAHVRRRVQEAGEASPARAAVGSVRDDLGSLWRSWRPGRTGSARADSAGIARLYREVLDRAEGTGHARRPAETPHEFAPVLQETFHRPVTDEITLAFEHARYAGRDPDPATLAALERRWRESV